MTSRAQTGGLREWLDWAAGAIRTAGWAPAGVFLLHAVLSRVLNAYGHWPWLDTPMHFVGGIAIAHFFARCVRGGAAKRLLGVLTPSGGELFTLALVCAACIVWEFAEWSTDRMGWTRAQGGTDDTMADMALGVGGGVAYLLLAKLFGRSRSA